MTLKLIFWILMLFWLVFGVWWNWPNRGPIVNSVLLFMLFLVLGWKVFGAPIQG